MVEEKGVAKVTTKKDQVKVIEPKNSSMKTMNKRKNRSVLSKRETNEWDRASKLLDRDQYQQAAALLDKILVHDRDIPKLYAHRGFAHYRLGNFARALPDFERAIELQPDAQNTRFLLARCLEEIDKFELAIVHYRHVIALKPDTADAHAHMGFCLERLGREEEATAEYELALKYDANESLALAGLKELQRHRKQ